MSDEQFASIWDAIEDTPAEAENMKLRAGLMRSLKDYVECSVLNHTEAPNLFGVTQPRVSDLMRGKINVFALDAFVNMAAAAGLHDEIRVVNAA